MKCKVTSITFDLDPGDDSIPQEHIDQVQQELQQDYIGEVFTVDDEDSMELIHQPEASEITSTRESSSSTVNTSPM